jgi:hypothetical protein
MQVCEDNFLNHTSQRLNSTHHRRGYLQKSLVLISRYPFVALFKKVIRLAAEDYFNQFDHVINSYAGTELLESCYCNISKWFSFFFFFCVSGWEGGEEREKDQLIGRIIDMASPRERG